MIPVGYATLITHDPHDAEDLIQSAYLRCLEHGRRDEVEALVSGTFRARFWFRTMQRIWIDRYRAMARRGGDHAEYTESQSLDDCPEAYMVLIEQVRRIEALPRKQRDVCRAFDLLGMSLIEVSESLGIPVGTVKSRLHRAREVLNGC